MNYEELVTSPQSVARKLIAHAGLPWDNRVAAYWSSAQKPAGGGGTGACRDGEIVGGPAEPDAFSPPHTLSVDRAEPYAAQLATLRQALVGCNARPRRRARNAIEKVRPVFHRATRAFTPTQLFSLD